MNKLFVIAILAIGCSSTSSGGVSCIPGDIKECQCGYGTLPFGEQTCGADGWLSCYCDTDGGSHE